MPRPHPSPRALTTSEERWNAGTHGVAALLSLGATGWLLWLATSTGQVRAILPVAAFGLTLVAAYLASTRYHLVRSEDARRTARLLDHIGIYLLIAGTYTPFSLIGLGGSLGWWLFGLVWAVALLGSGLEVAWLNRPRWLNALVFIAIGWIAIFFFGPLAAALPPAALHAVVAGGVIYSLGTVFYVWRRLPYHHAIWHLWVVAGSACHVVAVGLLLR